MGSADEIELVDDSEPEREAERVRRRERRAAKRAERQGLDEADRATSSALGVWKDNDEIQEVGSSMRSSLKETTSSYFGSKRAKDTPADRSPSQGSSRSGSTSSAFQAPRIPRSTPGSSKDFIYKHPSRSPEKESPAAPHVDLPVALPLAASSSTSAPSVANMSSKGKERKWDAGHILNPFTNEELQKVKACVLCKEDWSAAGVRSKGKWRHMVLCKSSMSTSALEQAVRAHLDGLRKKPARRASSDSTGKRGLPASVIASMKRSTAVEVLEIMDGDDDDGAGHVAADIFSTPSVDHPVDPPRSFSPFHSPSSTTSGVDISHPTSLASPPPKLDLAKFRLVQASSRAPSRQPSAGDVYSLVPPSAQPVPALQAAVPPGPAMPQVPDCPVEASIMKKLERCPICGGDRTTLKFIGKKKWPHVFTCAGSWTAETVADLKGLIEAEVNPPATLLEEQVHHRKKPTRKSSIVESTVLAANSEVGRLELQQRFEQVLAEKQPNFSDDDLAPPPFAPTQVFSTSRLGLEDRRLPAGPGCSTIGSGADVENAGNAPVPDHNSSISLAAIGGVLGDGSPSRKRKLGTSISADNDVLQPLAHGRSPKLATKLGGFAFRGSRGLFNLAAD